MFITTCNIKQKDTTWTITHSHTSFIEGSWTLKVVCASTVINELQTCNKYNINMQLEI